MNGEIKVLDGTYLASVTKAVYITDTDKNLDDFIIKIETKGNNLFNPLNKIEGKGYWKNGNSFTDPLFFSYLLPVEEGKSYSISASVEASYWGEKGLEYKDYISAVTYTAITGGHTFTVPLGQNIKYTLIVFRVTNLSTTMINEGNTLLTYEDYIGEKDIYGFQDIQTKPLSKSVSIDKLDNEVAEQLTRKCNNLTSIAKVPLFIETFYDGGNQPIHTKALYFENGFNGYKYWMAYTPFPFGRDQQENPCICCSNDMIKWEEPSGISNPLDLPGCTVDNKAIAYWSDTHLLYVNNQLELYYRGVYSNNGGSVIVKRTSTDGITWSDRQIVISFSDAQHVCPVVIHNGEKYLMWLFAPGEMFESTDGVSWTSLGKLKFINSTEKWHFDVIYNEKTNMYEMVQTSMYGETIEFLVSYDGIVWNKVKDIIVKDTVFFPNIDFYRPSFCMVNGYYNILYTMIDKASGYRLLGLSVGLNQYEPIVYGIDESYKNFMAKPTRRPKYVFEKEFYFDKSTSKLYYSTATGDKTAWKEITLI